MVHYIQYKNSQNQQLSQKGMQHAFALIFLDTVEVRASQQLQILWSDDTHFQLTGKVNTQHCCISDTENPRTFQEIPVHSPKVTVWCVFTATFILGTLLFEWVNRNCSVICTATTNRYKQMLETFLVLDKQQRQCQLNQLTLCKMERIHTAGSVYRRFFATVSLMTE